MLKPGFDLTALSPYENTVNAGNDVYPVPGFVGQTFDRCALRFAGFSTEYVQVPQVDAAGNPNGYNRWLNLSLRWDWRTHKSWLCHDENDGHLLNPYTSVGWNRVLAYPGDLSWLEGIVFSAPTGLGWYWTKFSAENLGVDQNAYALVNLIPHAQGGTGGIFDPLIMTP